MKFIITKKMKNSVSLKFTFLLICIFFSMKIYSQFGECTHMNGIGPENKNYLPPPDITFKEKMIIEFYCQATAPWGDDVINDEECSKTIKNSGCLLTCLSMIMKANGVDIDPGTLNTWLSDNNGFFGCRLRYASIDSYPKSTVTFADYEVTYSLQTVKKELDAGNPVIAHLNSNHYVLITGYVNEGNNSSDFYYHDPGSSNGADLDWSDEASNCVDLVIYHNVKYIFSYNISGYVKDADNNGIEGVTLTFEGNDASTTTATTDEDGYYIHEVPSDWEGTVRPSKPGYSFFGPAIRNYSDLEGNQTDQNYCGGELKELISISGIIKDDSGNPIENATITFDPPGNSIETDDNGNFEFTVESGWEGYIEVEADGYQNNKQNYGLYTTDINIGNIELSETGIHGCKLKYNINSNSGEYIFEIYSCTELDKIKWMVTGGNDYYYEKTNVSSYEESIGLPGPGWYTVCAEIFFYNGVSEEICKEIRYEGIRNCNFNNTKVVSDFEIIGGSRIFKKGSTVTFMDASRSEQRNPDFEEYYPDQIADPCPISTWIWDLDWEHDDCPWWAGKNHDCRYDEGYLENDYKQYVNKTYNSKGIYIIELHVHDADESKVKISPSGGIAHVSHGKKWGWVAIVDCDAVTTSDDRSSQVVRDKENYTYYYSGIFRLYDELPDQNIKNTSIKYIACDQIELQAGFHAKAASGQTIRFTPDHPNLQNTVKSTYVTENNDKKSYLIEKDDYYNDEQNHLLNKDTIIKKEIVNIYPNPSNGIINIELNCAISNVEIIEINNTSGLNVKTIKPSSNVINVNLNKYAGNIYFIKTIFVDKVITKKVIIQ